MVAFSQSTANLEKGVMLKGYDPVSYFKNQPIKGESKIKAEHKGLTYLFSAEENKTLFLAQPEAYVPQYEGWCATAVAGGYKFDIDPTHYRITNGKLYLFYKGWRGDAKKDWLKNEPEQILKANQNWPVVAKSKE